MQIGNITLKNNVFLAPMAGITDMPFRILCKEQGCSLVYSEMVSAKGMHFQNAKTYKLIEASSFERPISVQIFGCDPFIMASIAEKLNHCDIDFIDINMGCPTPKITKNGEGSALMRQPKLVAKIVKKVSNVSAHPVTIKIRKGWDDNSVNAIEIAKIAEENGAKAIAVHARTREQFYEGTADWNIIKEVKSHISIPVIGNGDIKCPEDAKNMLNFTGCDAIMIGRASRGNPWIFNQVISFLDGSVKIPLPSFDERKNMILRHLNLLIEHKGEAQGVREMRKHIAWYIKGLNNSAQIKNKIFKATSINEVTSLIEEYFE